jgi:predicted XRE-type DNA-binding protein
MASPRKKWAKIEGHLNSVYAARPIEYANLDMRRALMRYISDSIADARLSQAMAARLFGVTQPRISNLMRGRVESFSIDSLVNMLGRQGMRVVVSFEVAR